MNEFITDNMHVLFFFHPAPTLLDYYTCTSIARPRVHIQYTCQYISNEQHCRMLLEVVNDNLVWYIYLYTYELGFPLSMSGP